VAWRQDAASDGALVAAVGESGDPSRAPDAHEALAEIYRRYGGAVWSVARQVCRSAELAEEVCQTVFTDLWSRPARFDPSRGGLRPWLVAQAHSRAIDVVRSEEARRRRQARDVRMTDADAGFY
jgi:RNA polymerase sigma factor (sigma-70 family)